LEIEKFGISLPACGVVILAVRSIWRDGQVDWHPASFLVLTR
jgi:hypothetical protein